MEAARPLLLVTSLVAAQSASAVIALEDFGGSLGITSDYVNHGISQTCGHPAASADVHYRTGGGQSQSEGFAGVWGSAGFTDSPCGRSREFIIYAGYSVLLDQNQSVALTYTHYGYPGGSYTIAPLSGFRYDYDSLEGQWAWQDRVYLTLAWTPDAFRVEHYTPYRDRNAVALGLQVHQPLRGGLSMSAGVGYDQIPDPSGAGYAFWDAGLGYAWGPVELQASYFGTSRQAQHTFRSSAAGNRVAVSALWRF